MVWPPLHALRFLRHWWIDTTRFQRSVKPISFDHAIPILIFAQRTPGLFFAEIKSLSENSPSPVYCWLSPPRSACTPLCSPIPGKKQSQFYRRRRRTASEILSHSADRSTVPISHMMPLPSRLSTMRLRSKLFSAL